jgi:hypothetical protein
MFGSSFPIEEGFGERKRRQILTAWVRMRFPACLGRAIRGICADNRNGSVDMKRIAATFALCALLCACASQPKQVAPVALPPAPPPGEPGDLAGIDATALRASFGAPVFVRKDGAIEMWRYDNAACKAFFFLYPTGAALTVRHVETIPRGHDMAADADCLAQLRIRTNAPVS